MNILGDTHDKTYIIYDRETIKKDELRVKGYI